MEDVVAVELVMPDGSRHQVLTLGRIQDAVDPAPLEAIVREHASMFGLGGAVVVRVCGSLQEAREAPYFFEALVGIGAKLAEPRRRDDPTRWKGEVGREMRTGRHLHHLGDPGAAWFRDGPGRRS